MSSVTSCDSFEGEPLPPDLALQGLYGVYEEWLVCPETGRTFPYPVYPK